jgi:hypothetical protein
MKVQAKTMGFYKGRRYREGAEFEVPEGTASKWFEPVTVQTAPSKPVASKSAPKGKPEKADDLV